MSHGNTARSLIERAAIHGRTLVLTGVGLAAVLGLWITLRTGDVLMQPSAPAPATLAYALLLFIMWWSMMLAMMLPSAAPALLTYAAMNRRMPDAAPAAVFAAGYAAIWTLFSLAAVALQIITREVVPMTAMMAVVSVSIGGLLLIAAGLYQLTPLKSACLRHCQSPLMFFARQWRKGWGGAFRMGLAHGTYCLGCCWVLMTLLFYGGVMEPRWIVGLALYIALEKLIPARSRLAPLAGIVLIAWGGLTLYGAIN